MHWWRWVFSSSRRKALLSCIVPSFIERLPYSLFSLIFPDQCRICHAPLVELSRAPVCRKCLRAPEPLTAEYFCLSCRTPFQTPYPLDTDGRCGLCRNGLTGFDAAYSFGAYEGMLRELIHLYKYGRMRPLAEPLGDLMALALPREQQFDLVVPVPLHWFRLWRRGFNQSALLARGMARRCAIPVAHVLRRSRATSSQAGLSRTRRRQNVDGAFRVSRGARLAGQRILLIDDVLTTGATAAACARTLKRAGARSVSVLTLARVDRRATASDQARKGAVAV